jgi:hypothetical protein
MKEEREVPRHGKALRSDGEHARKAYKKPGPTVYSNLGAVTGLRS